MKKNTEITLAMLAANAPAFKAEVTMNDIAPKESTPASTSSDDTVEALVCDLPKEEPQVNYLWELYAAQERRKKNPQPEVKRTESFDSLSVLAGAQR